MSDKTPSWKDHLTEVGQLAFYEEHRKLLEEAAPDGPAGSALWNELSCEAIIKAVAAMIEANNTALLTEIDCLRDDA